MGVTNFEIEKLNWILDTYNPKSVMELGAQSNYTIPYDLTPQFMSSWFIKRGISYKSIDLAGDNNSEKVDLTKNVYSTFPFELVTDFGTSEHCVRMDDYVVVAFHEGHINSIYPKGILTDDDIKIGYYNCWKNKHELTKIGGIIFSVNPMTKHWGGHGYSYLGYDFYTQLGEITEYDIVEYGVCAAMGNFTSGMNVFGIIRKTSESFPDIDLFYTLPIFKK